MLIIALTGLARSGKDEVANHLVSMYGFKKLVFSDLLKAEVSSRDLRITKENLSIVGADLRTKLGMGFLGERMSKKIQDEMLADENAEKFVLSGLRSVEEFNYLKDKFVNIYLIEVTAEDEERYNRRTEKDPQTKEEFFYRDKRDGEKAGLYDAIKASEYTIKNDESFSKLHIQISKLLNDLGEEPLVENLTEFTGDANV